jgi:hypothetical protein
VIVSKISRRVISLIVLGVALGRRGIRSLWRASGEGRLPSA